MCAIASKRCLNFINSMKTNTKWVVVFITCLMALIILYLSQSFLAPYHREFNSPTLHPKPISADISFTDVKSAPNAIKADTISNAPNLTQPTNEGRVAPPTSAVIKTVTDNTPRATDLMKVYRIVKDPLGLASEVSKYVKISKSRVVWPPIPYYNTSARKLSSDGLPSGNDLSTLFYVVQDSSNGSVVGNVGFHGSGDRADAYQMAEIKTPGFFESSLAETLNYLAGLDDVQNGSYEPCYIQYGQYPAIAYAVWLRSPSGKADLIYPLPGRGIIGNGHPPYGLQPMLYKANDFLAQIKAAMYTGNNN